MEFSLINEMNQRFYLKQFAEFGLIPSVGGLGYSYDASYVRVGNAYKRDSKTLSQGELSGTVIFPSYENYQAFVHFIETSTALRAIYKPLGTEYFVDVDLTEISNLTVKGGTTECEVAFKTTSLYYTEDNQRFVVETIANEAAWDFVFDEAIYNDYSNLSVDLVNAGHAEGDLLAEIHGFAINPEITLSVGSEVLYKVAFNLTVQEGEKLLYSAKDGDNYVVLEKADGTQTDAVGALLLENDNFFRIPKGYFKLSASAENGIMGTVIYRILTPYKAV